MADLPGYDAWKLATPPHYEDSPEYCRKHGWEADGPDEHDCPYCDPEYDPSPYCSGCGSMTMAGCDCGPIAEND